MSNRDSLEDVTEDLAGQVFGDEDMTGGVSDADLAGDNQPPAQQQQDADRQFEGGRDQQPQRQQPPAQQRPPQGNQRPAPPSSDDFDPTLFYSTENQPQADGWQQPYNPAQNAEQIADAYQQFDTQQGNENITGYYNEDANGNLIDETGAIIARAGRSRRAFERVRNFGAKEREANVKLARNVLELSTTLRDLHTKYKSERDRKTIGDEYNLSDPELRQAAEIISLAKTDAKAALKKVLTIAHVRGMDLSDLGADLGGYDAAEVAREMFRLQQEEQASAEQKRIETERESIRREVEDFRIRNPDVDGQTPEGTPFLRFVVEAKTRFPQLTLDECWQRIKQAASAAAAGKRNNPPQDRRQRGGPVPQQRQQGNGAGQPVTTVRTAVDPVRQNQGAPRQRGINIDPVHPSTSFDDIATGVLRDIQREGL